MPLELIWLLPRWFILGILLGLVFAGIIAVVFVIGVVVYPDQVDRSHFRNDTSSERKQREIRWFLRTIGEPFIEDYILGDEVVGFYLSDRNVSITLDAKTFFSVNRLGHTAVLVEHEMPITQLGARLPFDTPSIPTAQPSTRSITESERILAAFRELGLTPSASEAEIRQAYRREIKRVHPDHGGDRSSFDRVREAYVIASREAGTPVDQPTSTTS